MLIANTNYLHQPFIQLHHDEIINMYLIQVHDNKLINLPNQHTTLLIPNLTTLLILKLTTDLNFTTNQN